MNPNTYVEAEVTSAMCIVERWQNEYLVKLLIKHLLQLLAQ